MPYTLTVNFNLASPDPGSYRVKFWPTSNPASITTRMVSNSPFVEGNLSETSYAGTIEASCGSGNYSTPVSFSSSVPTVNLYLIAHEFDAGSGNQGIKWLLTTAGGGADTANTDLPFDVRVAYTADGININGGAITSPLLVSGLEIPAGVGEVSQGTLASDWTNVYNVNIGFKTGLGAWTAYTTVISPTGTTINQPISYYYTPTSTLYRLNVIRNSFALLT